MDSGRRKEIRHRRPRDEPAYNMVNLSRRLDTVHSVNLGETEYDQQERKRNLIPMLWCGLTILAIVIIDILLYSHHHEGLPTALTINDLVEGEDIFIAERARSDQIGLANIGVKIVGSYENEVLAVEYLNHHLQQIQAQATNTKTVEIDISRSSGAYYLTGTIQGLTNVYINVANVAARLSGTNSSGNALLVNCHYDSVPVSPGANDNGVNCAIMLEVLRVLSRSTTELTHDVIFLFNGAEENPLQASHAFITNHVWATDVKAFINYDSAGYGGREALFQSGNKNAWLSAYYASVVPHPHTTAVMTDVFESGLVPSDTDYRIFTQFGGVYGLDFAHYIGGYVYHTSYDNYDITPYGTIQHTGDNMLALVKALANAPELAEDEVNGEVLFYDIFGLFVVRYSKTVATIVNIVVSIIGILSSFWLTLYGGIKETSLSILASFAFQSIGLLLGFGLTAFVGMILDWSGNAMSWFSKPGFAIGLFVLPALLPSIIINWALCVRPIKQSRFGIGQRVQMNTQTVTIFWSIVLIVLSVFRIKSAYVICIIVGFVTAANIITSVLKLQRLVKVWVATYIAIGLLIPTLYILWLSSMVTALVPIMGRSGAHTIPDLTISLIFGGIAILYGSFWVPLIGALKRPQILVLGVSLASIITILGATVTSYGFPYSVDLSSPKPQRFWLIHVERTVYDINGSEIYNDGGYWIQHLDRNGPRTFQQYISEYDNATLTENNCIDAAFCGLPLWKTRDINQLNQSYWIPSEAPTIQQYQPSRLVGEWNVTSGGTRRLTFNLTGPDHMTIWLAPKDGVTLLNWSLLDEVPAANTWNGKPFYFIIYDYGTEPENPDEIWLDLSVPDGVSPAIEIALNAHYLHNTTSTTAPYESILQQLPLWVTPLYWSSTYKSYSF